MELSHTKDPWKEQILLRVYVQRPLQPHLLAPREPVLGNPIAATNWTRDSTIPVRYNVCELTSGEPGNKQEEIGILPPLSEDHQTIAWPFYVHRSFAYSLQSLTQHHVHMFPFGARFLPIQPFLSDSADARQADWWNQSPNNVGMVTNDYVVIEPLTNSVEMHQQRLQEDVLLSKYEHEIHALRRQQNITDRAEEMGCDALLLGIQRTCEEIDQLDDSEAMLWIEFDTLYLGRDSERGTRNREHGGCDDPSDMDGYNGATTAKPWSTSKMPNRSNVGHSKIQEKSPSPVRRWDLDSRDCLHASTRSKQFSVHRQSTPKRRNPPFRTFQTPSIRTGHQPSRSQARHWAPALSSTSRLVRLSSSSPCTSASRSRPSSKTNLPMHKETSVTPGGRLIRRNSRQGRNQRTPWYTISGSHRILPRSVEACGV